MGTENKIKIIHIVARRYFLLEALYLDDIGIKFAGGFKTQNAEDLQILCELNRHTDSAR